LETSFIEGKISSLQKIIDLNKEVGQLNLLLGQNLEYCKQFEDDVDILSKNLIVSYDKIPSYGDIVYNLYETSQIALGNKNKRNNLENSKQTLLRNIAAYEHNIQKAEKAIKKCCSDADIAYENFHLLPELELKSANKLSLDTTIFKLKKELFISEGNKDFDEVNKYLSLIDETSIRSRLSEISEEIQNLENEKDSYNSNHGSIVERRKVLLNNDGSYMLEQDLQSKAADIKSRIKEYFTYLVSIQILEKTIEHYKNIHQHPILNRAGQIFQRLTLGNYIRLVVDYEKDKTILLGVLHNGENLNPTEMSKGTRDQLFLSLRLAAIELYNNSNEPMPILLDDVLIQYDEQRIKAALTVLAEMSSNTQVIFFTHNSNIVRLAKEVIDQEVLKIISLDKTYSIRS
jgi:uncharacterized protein YhaN